MMQRMPIQLNLPKNTSSTRRSRDTERTTRANAADLVLFKMYKETARIKSGLNSQKRKKKLQLKTTRNRLIQPKILSVILTKFVEISGKFSAKSKSLIIYIQKKMAVHMNFERAANSPSGSHKRVAGRDDE